MFVITFYLYTFQLKAYAQSQDAAPDIDNTYVGWAVYGGDFDVITDDVFHGGVKKYIVQAAYTVPIAAIFILIIVMSILIPAIIFYKPANKLLQKRLNVIIESTSSQATLFTLVLLSIITTLYISFWDFYTIHPTSRLPSYYSNNDFEFQITCIIGTSALISSSMVFICLIIFAALGIIIRFCPPKEHHINELLFIAAVLTCFGSSILQISVHIPNILMAWSGDPFYASRIAIYYAIFIFSNFIASKNAYIVGYKAGTYCYKMYPTRARQIEKNIDGYKCSCHTIFLVIFSVFIAIIVVNGILVTITIFVVSIPVHNSISEAADGVTSIYNGGVVLIGGIIAYNVGWYYFFGSFSLEEALKAAMKEMETPFSYDANGNWEMLTEEGRMTQVMKALVYRQTFTGPWCSALHSALVVIIRNARKDNKAINPPGNQVMSLSTLICDYINIAMRNAEPKDIDTLLQVLNEPTFVLDSEAIDLAKQPTMSKLNVMGMEITNALRNTQHCNPIDDIKTALINVLNPNHQPVEPDCGINSTNMST